MTDPAATFCTLSASDQLNRQSRVISELKPQLLSIRKQPNGLILQFNPSNQTKNKLDEFIALEKSCCSFLKFTTIQSSTSIQLRILGPLSATDVIDMFYKTMTQEPQ